MPVSQRVGRQSPGSPAARRRSGSCTSSRFLSPGGAVLRLPAETSEPSLPTGHLLELVPALGETGAEAEETGMTEGRTPSLLRARAGSQRVTNVELFFDLVYVFAVTQLSHHLLSRPTVDGALQTGLLLAMVWLVWSYTTWVTNSLDPERIPVTLTLVCLMLLSLVVSSPLRGGVWRGAVWAGV